MSHSPKKIVGGMLAALLALFAAVVVATPAVADETVMPMAYYGAPGGNVTNAQTLVDALGNNATADTVNNVVTLNNDVQLQTPLNFKLGTSSLTLNLSKNSIAASNEADTAVTMTSGTLTIQGSGTISTNNSAAVSYTKGSPVAPTVNVVGGNLTLAGPNVSGPTGGNAILMPGVNPSTESEPSLTISGGSVSTSNGITAICVGQGESGDDDGYDWDGFCSLTISGGTITGGGEVAGISGWTQPKQPANACAVALYGNSTLTMTGGSVSVPAEQETGTGIGVFNAADVTRISGGTISGPDFGLSTWGGASGTNTINITGGEISGGGAGIYLPNNSGNNEAKNTLTVSGDAKITGGAGIVSIGSNMNIQGGTITATSNEPVKVGDSGNSFPPAAVVQAGTVGGYGTAGAKSVQVSGGTMVAAEGQPAVAYQASSYQESDPAASNDNGAFDITGGSFSAPVQGSYLNSDMEVMATAPSGDAPYSYWYSEQQAEGRVPGAAITQLDEVSVVEQGFAPVAADAAEDIAAAVNATIPGSEAEADDYTTSNNTMWAIAKGAPNTSVQVSFFAPVNGKAATGTQRSAFSQLVTTNENGYALVYFTFGASSGDAYPAGSTYPSGGTVTASLAAGPWVSVVQIANEVTTDGNIAIPATGTDTVTLASVKVEAGSNVAYTAPAQAVSDTLYFVDGTQVELPTVTASSNNVFVGWYQNTAASTATPNCQAVTGPITATGAITINAGTVSYKFGDNSITFVPATVVASNPTVGTITLTLPATPTTGTYDVAIANAAAQANKVTVPADDVNTIVLNAVTAALSSDPVDPEAETPVSYFNTNLTWGKSNPAGVTASLTSAPELGTSKDGKNPVITATVTATPAKDPGSGGSVTATLKVSELGLTSVTGTFTVKAARPVDVDGNGSVTQTFNSETNTYTLTAVTEPYGSTFVGWKNQYGTIVSTQNPYTIASIAEGGSLTAVFEGGTPAPTPETGTVDVKRFYNPWLSGAHLLSADPEEWTALTDAGWQDEGAKFTEYATAANAPAGTDVVAVYRLYNPYNGDHYNTASLEEAQSLTSPSVGWEWDNDGEPVFYAPANSSFPVTKLYNKWMTENAGLGNHVWTAQPSEVSMLTGLGWTNENAAWFAVSVVPQQV